MAEEDGDGVKQGVQEQGTVRVGVLGTRPDAIDMRLRSAYSQGMEFRLEPALAAKVDRWSAQTGRPVGELVEDAIAGYFNELGELRSMLDRRFGEMACGEVQPIDGAEAYRQLMERAAERQKSIS